MKLIPILFQPNMVGAIIEDRKTMTRRVADIPGGDLLDFPYATHPYERDGDWFYHAQIDENGYPDYEKRHITHRYGQPGDVLWVRETFYAYGNWDLKPSKKKGKAFENHFNDLTHDCKGGRYGYLDKPCPRVLTGRTSAIGWYKRPSIFIPFNASRIFLVNTGVKCERLNDISEADAIAEGVEKRPGSNTSTRFDYRHYGYEGSYDVDAKVSFLTLWDKINGIESRKANPWLWAISFKVISKTGRNDYINRLIEKCGKKPI